MLPEVAYNVLLLFAACAVRVAACVEQICIHAAVRRWVAGILLLVTALECASPIGSKTGGEAGLSTCSTCYTGPSSPELHTTGLRC